MELKVITVENQWGLLLVSQACITTLEPQFEEQEQSDGSR